MRVALDVSPLVAGDTGSARFTRELWKQLLLRSDVDVCALALGRGPTLDGPVKQLRWPLRALHAMWKVARWPTVRSLVGHVDVVHSMDLVPPPTRQRLVVTVNDALSLTHPHFLPGRAIRLQRRQLAAAKGADAVVTISQATADVLVRSLGIRPDRLVVAPLAPGPVPDRPPCPPFGDPYILAVGSVTPRKGFEVLARAAALLGAACPDVVVAGPDGWNADAVRRGVDEVDASRRVRFIGRVSDEELQGLYSHAMVVCHPSLAEGFGIVCLEAMSFGVPVVASELPSVREFAGDAVLYSAPGEPESLADRLREVLADEPLRRRLGEEGERTASDYTWERTTNRVVHAYHLSMSGRPR